ncbi:VCBS repeat-containing protein [Candidatus Nitrospira allomarina]|uniref:VCBS repeat-containing protein n=1 Tax=Candidatus Nitrospira allomarina TaxID=3020900 RepID=A0AA96GAX1_9BACT|nr:VCBS repeat-containing protein [Candidatus Nitrospira allomarina]WNM56615.1 VCBS repeat-containing protein [Candidatus Nitrospira allomarina]
MNASRTGGWIVGLAAVVLTMGTASMAQAAGFTAYNDLAWGTGQLETNITKFTSPNGGSGLPATGLLKDFATGLDTSVTMTVAGGLFVAGVNDLQGTDPTTGDAFAIFDGKVNGKGVLTYIDDVNNSLVLTFSGLNPGKTYNLTFYAHRNNNGWDRASLVTLSGQDAFTNTSSVATDNPNTGTYPGGVLFTGPTSASTRLPADNDNGYVAQFSGIDPGSDGTVVLTISFDGSVSEQYKGKYGSAVRLIESSGSGGQDLNGDGKADLVFRNTNGNAAVWLLNGAAAPLSTVSLGGVGSDWEVAGVGDTDADGNADIIWRNTTTGAVAVWLMNGGTRISAGLPGTASTAWTIQGVGDLNGDDKADLVFRHTNGSAAVWLLNGTAPPSSTGSLGVVSSDYQISGVGDTDADGNADIIWRNTTNGAVAVWLMNGLTRTSVGFPGTASTAWTIQGVGDLNGDGKADLVFRHTNGSAAVWLLNGTATPSSTASLGVVGSVWRLRQVGDTDADGNADIIWRNTSSGAVAVWLMNGVTRTSVGFPGTASTAWEIQP